MSATSEMTAADVVKVIVELEGAGIEVWVDGGWGVDALLGEQTRPHADLDLALDRRSLNSAQVTLEGLGFAFDETASPGPPGRFVFVDETGRTVDLHPLAFDREGNGWQELGQAGESWGRYPAGDLQATGRIGDREVRCLSAGLQYRFHLGYAPAPRDEHDLRMLAERFGVGPDAGRASVDRSRS